MASKLTTKKREAMFRAWVEHPTISFVVKKCRVNWITVKKYRNLDGWDDRIKDVKAAAANKADDQMVDVLAENIKLVRFMKAQLVNELKGKIAAAEDGKTATTKDLYAALVKVMAFELELTGNPQERGRAVEELQEPGPYDNMTVEELLVIRRQIVTVSAKGNGNGGNGNGNGRHRRKVASRVKSN